MAEPNYGKDIALVIGGGVVDLDATFRMVEGAQLMAQVCVERLYCRKGRLLSDPNDNTIDARDFISQGIAGTAAGLQRIKGLCQAAIAGDPRVFTIVVEPTYNAVTRALDLSCRGTGSSGPFALTLRITELTVDVLRPS